MIQRRKGLRRETPKAKARKKALAEAKDFYYQQHQDTYGRAPCQIGGHLIFRAEATYDHLKTRHHGEADGLDDGLVACWPCHTWLQQRTAWRRLLLENPPTIRNGEILNLPEEINEDRLKFVRGFTGNPHRK